jgi:hypothetical protein
MHNSEITNTIKLLKQHYNKLTSQQFKTLKGQCIAGDVQGAKKGLANILGKEV